MKITGIEMFPVSIAFKRKVKTAFRGFARDEGVCEENVVIRIYTDEGVSGLGEAGTWGVYYSRTRTWQTTPRWTSVLAS